MLKASEQLIKYAKKNARGSKTIGNHWVRIYLHTKLQDGRIQAVAKEVIYGYFDTGIVRVWIDLDTKDKSVSYHTGGWWTRSTMRAIRGYMEEYGKAEVTE